MVTQRTIEWTTLLAMLLIRAEFKLRGVRECFKCILGHIARSTKTERKQKDSLTDYSPNYVIRFRVGSTEFLRARHGNMSGCAREGRVSWAVELLYGQHCGILEVTPRASHTQGWLSLIAAFHLETTSPRRRYVIDCVFRYLPCCCGDVQLRTYCGTPLPSTYLDFWSSWGTSLSQILLNTALDGPRLRDISWASTWKRQVITWLCMNARFLPPFLLWSVAMW